MYCTNPERSLCTRLYHRPSTWARNFLPRDYSWILLLSLSFPLSNDPLSESPAILVISRRSMTTRFRIPSSIWLSRTLCPWLVHLTDRISRLNASLSNGRTYEPLASLLLASVDRRVECSSLCAHGVFNARRGKESRVRRSWSSTALRQTEIKLALDTAAVSREQVWKSYESRMAQSLDS